MREFIFIAMFLKGNRFKSTKSTKREKRKENRIYHNNVTILIFKRADLYFNMRIACYFLFFFCELNVI